jgi:hypothetical protein
LNASRHVGHGAQRERHDRAQPDQAQDHRGKAQRHDGAERDECRAARSRIRRARCHRIDEVSGKYRHEQVGHGRAEQTAGNDRGADRLIAPMAKHEGQHHANRGGALVGLIGHGVIRLRSRARRLHRVDARRQKPNPSVVENVCKNRELE